MSHLDEAEAALRRYDGAAAVDRYLAAVEADDSGDLPRAYAEKISAGGDDEDPDTVASIRLDVAVMTTMPQTCLSRRRANPVDRTRPVGGSACPDCQIR